MKKKLAIGTTGTGMIRTMILNRICMRNIKLLKGLKELDIYFIPFTVDGNWDYADNIKVLDKEELISDLRKLNEWSYAVNQCLLNFPVYMLEVIVNSKSLKKEILHPFQKFRNSYWNTEIKSNITLYLSYNDMCKLSRRGCIKRKKDVFYI